jgi:predicted ABC-type ATPase
LQLERIKTRVAKGGHDVPPDKVAARRKRSIAQMAWFYRMADRAWLFDNSDDSPVIVRYKELVSRNHGVTATHAMSKIYKIPKDIELGLVVDISNSNLA